MDLMKALITYLMLCLAGLGGCGLLGGGGNSPTIPGKIVFSAKDAGGTYQIFTMNADGSNVRQLTDGEFFSISPAWSPDGQRIAFASNRQAPVGFTTLRVMEADGDNLQPLVLHPQTGRPMFGNHPAWSPDGTKLAFDYCISCELGGGNEQVFLADLQAGTLDTLVQHPANNRLPAWSPGGERIAFISDRDYFNADTLRFRADIYSIRLDGTDLERITKTGFARDPVWNPNGSSIGFRSSSSSLGLFQVDVQSGSIFEIIEDLKKNVQLFPMAWSSDGQKLLVITRELSKPLDFSLYLIDTKTGQTKLIPFGPAEIMGADWVLTTDN